MSKLIEADLKRILRKPTFYILIVLELISFASGNAADSAMDQIQRFRNLLDFDSMFAIGIPVFLAVYADEFRHGVMINVIGRGMSRKKIILAKMIDVGILFLMFYAITFLICFIENVTSGLSVTPKQNFFLLIYCLFRALKGIGFIALAAFVAFATWSAAGGMTILILGGALSGLFLKALQTELSVPLYDLSFEGLLDASYNTFAAGGFGWQLIPAIGIYLCGIVILTILAFNRREIDL